MPTTRTREYLEGAYAARARRTAPRGLAWAAACAVRAEDLPAAIRWLEPYLWWTTLIFLLAAAGGYALVHRYPDLIGLFASPQLIASVERGKLWTDGLLNIVPSSILSVQILANNVVVSLFAYCAGLFFGLGTLYILGLNGLMLGAVFAFVGAHGLAGELADSSCATVASNFGDVPVRGGRGRGWRGADPAGTRRAHGILPRRSAALRRRAARLRGVPGRAGTYRRLRLAQPARSIKRPRGDRRGLLAGDAGLVCRACCSRRAHGRGQAAARCAASGAAPRSGEKRALQRRRRGGHDRHAQSLQQCALAGGARFWCSWAASAIQGSARPRRAASKRGNLATQHPATMTRCGGARSLTARASCAATLASSRSVSRITSARCLSRRRISTAALVGSDSAARRGAFERRANAHHPRPRSGAQLVRMRRRTPPARCGHLMGGDLGQTCREVAVDSEVVERTAAHPAKAPGIDRDQHVQMLILGVLAGDSARLRAVAFQSIRPSGSPRT